MSRVPWFGCGMLFAMPPAMTDQLDVWADPVLDGNDQVAVDFLLPTGIYIQMDVPRESTIQQIKQVCGIITNFLTLFTKLSPFICLCSFMYFKIYKRPFSSIPSKVLGQRSSLWFILQCPIFCNITGLLNNIHSYMVTHLMSKFSQNNFL